jgi:integrase
MPRQAQPHYEEKRNQWYIYVNYEKKYLCSGKGNWAEAARRAERFLGKPAHLGEVETIAQAIEQWLIKNGTDWKRGQLVPWNRFAGAMRLAELNEDHLVDFLTYLRKTGYTRVYQKRTLNEHGKIPNAREKKFEYSAKNLRTMIGLAHAVLVWSAEPPRRWLDVIPRRPDDIPPPRKLYRDVARPRLREAFADLPKRSSPICRFIVNVGCRPGEACQLQWSQVDLEGWTCRLAEHKTEESTGQDRTLYLTPAAIAILRDQPRVGAYVFLNRFGRPYKPNGLRSILRRRGITGGYALRHTYAQSAREAGVELDVLQKHLGHKHLSTTQVYAQVRDPHAARVARALPSPLQAPPVESSTPETSAAESPESQAADQSTRRRRNRAPDHHRGGRRAASRRRSV